MNVFLQGVVHRCTQRTNAGFPVTIFENKNSPLYMYSTLYII
jgi:hypothetical protein